MQVEIQRILLKAGTVDEARKFHIAAAQALRPLGGYATDVVDEKRINEPSKYSPFVEWLRVCLLQKVHQDHPS